MPYYLFIILIVFLLFLFCIINRKCFKLRNGYQNLDEREYQNLDERVEAAYDSAEEVIIKNPKEYEIANYFYETNNVNQYFWSLLSCNEWD